MITSTSNARVKRLVNLVKKRRERDREGVFLVEGPRMFREAPKDQIQEVYVSESFFQKGGEAADWLRAGDAAGEVLADHVFSHVSDTQTPQGVLAVVRRPAYTLEDVISGACPQLLVLENLQDPGNLGTIVRTAEGAGVTGIVLSSGCVDLYNPKTIRSTMGSIYRMPICCAADLHSALGEMKRQGICTYAAHLDGEQSYDQEDYRRPCAFLIGNEGNGLTKETAAAADRLVRIPMSGQVESLNAAIAAAVLMFEASRQRRGTGHF